LWQVVEPQRGTRDPNRVVAHSLQLEHHVLEAHDQAQVASHRLLGGHDHEGPLAEQAMQLIHLLVARDDFFGQRIVAIDQCPHRLGDRLLDHAAHADHARLQLGELLIEKGPRGGHDGGSTRSGR